MRGQLVHPFMMLIHTQYNFILTAVVGFSSLGLFVMHACRHNWPYPLGPSHLPVVNNLFSMPLQEEWVAYKKWSEKCGVNDLFTLFVFTLCLTNWRWLGSDVVMPQLALSCDVRGRVYSGVKSYQDFSMVMNKIVGARLYQI